MDTRRDFLKSIGAGAFALTAPLPALAQMPGGKRRPNILLILADDLGWSDLGCYGGEIETPNLDMLASKGIRFTQFHNTAKCFPSRASLLTGLYAQQCGMSERPGHLKNCVTLGEVLRAGGYRTLMTGKHHGLDNPYHRGFDRYYGLRDGCCNYFNPGMQRPGEGVPAQKRRNRRAWCIDDRTLLPYTPEDKGFYTTDYFTRYALSYLDEYSKEDKPFFLYLAYTAPHDPLMAWPDDIDKYRGMYMKGFGKIRAARYELQRKTGLANEKSPLSEALHRDWETLSPEQKKEEDLKMAVYAAMIDRMDRNIGKVLSRIRELGKEDDTLVLFASDNGCSAEVVKIDGTGEIGSMTRWTSLGRDWANVSDTPYRFFKNYSHEGGICTPLIACWPEGIADPGRLSHHVGHFIDIMATLVDASGAEYPEEFNNEKIAPIEGKSLIPVFENKKAYEHDALFWQWSKGKAVRTNRWKLVSWDKKAGWELYDMENDRTETENVAKDHTDVVARLAALHEKWEARCL